MATGTTAAGTQLKTRITMLGGNSVGKTCYLASLYATMSDGVRGFTFTAPHDQARDLEDKYDQMTRPTGTERWPAPTAEGVRPYRFEFQHGWKTFIEFDWVDYRGGALADDPTEGDLKELTLKLCESECVILCVSGQHLAELSGKSEVMKASRIREMNRIMSIVRNDVEARGGNLPSTVIAVTKYDYWMSCGHSREALFDRVREVFHPLFAPGAGWLTAVCPLTLGLDLAGNENAPGMALHPENIHLPVSFAVYNVLQRASIAAEQEVASAGRKVEKLKANLSNAQEDVDRHANRNLFEKLRDRFNGKADPSARQRSLERELTEYLGRAQRQAAGLESLRKNVSLLFRDMVGGVPIYFDGQEVEIAH